MDNESLIKLLKNEDVLKSPKIEQALKSVPREFFVPKDHKSEAYENYPLPIGEGQTISQPLTVVTMLEALNVEKGNNILEIGYGSGWVTALLAYLTDGGGHVHAFEIKEKVAQFGKENIINFCSDETCSFSTHKITLHHESYAKHFNNFAPYERIVSGAAFEKIPEDLANSLKTGGRLVAPTAQNDIRVLIKKDGVIEEQIIPGFVFVPIK